MKKLPWVVLLGLVVLLSGCHRDSDDDTTVVKKTYVTTVEPADVVVEVSCQCLCHDHEGNDGHSDGWIPPGHRR